jgi:translation initiation factor IF-2
MSKVRVYELAKEAGLKSKELADKLIAMGFPIASHSSSVDDDMAADIRKKLKSEAVTGTAEGRIELRTRTESVTPKTTTVIRRRSKAEKEETAKKLEEAEALVIEAETLEFEAKVQEQIRAAEEPPPMEKTVPAVVDDEQPAPKREQEQGDEEENAVRGPRGNGE